MGKKGMGEDRKVNSIMRGNSKEVGLEMSGQESLNKLRINTAMIEIKIRTLAKYLRDNKLPTIGAIQT